MGFEWGKPELCSWTIATAIYNVFITMFALKPDTHTVLHFE